MRAILAGSKKRPPPGEGGGLSRSSYVTRRILSDPFLFLVPMSLRWNAFVRGFSGICARGVEAKDSSWQATAVAYEVETSRKASCAVATARPSSMAGAFAVAPAGSRVTGVPIHTVCSWGVVTGKFIAAVPGIISRPITKCDLPRDDTAGLLPTVCREERAIHVWRRKPPLVWRMADRIHIAAVDADRLAVSAAVWIRVRRGRTGQRRGGGE